MKIFSAVLILSFCLSGCGSLIQPPQSHRKIMPEEFSKKFTPDELKADIAFMVKTFEDVHPNLYAYISRESFQKQREDIEQDITTPLTRIEFYRKIAPLANKIDGHTSISPPTEEYNSYAEKNGLRFPFDLAIVESKILVTENYSDDTTIIAGSELTSVNGVSTPIWLDSLAQYWAGERNSFRRAAVVEYSKLMMWLVFGWGKTFEIEFVTQQGERKIARVQGVTTESIKKKIETQKKTGTSNYAYSFKVIDSLRLGLLDFQSMDGKLYERFKEFLKTTFAQIRKDSVRHLVIDLRRNGGGSSQLGNALLNYITDKPFRQVSRVEMKASDQVRDYFYNFLPFYLRWLRIFGLHNVEPSISPLFNAPKDSIGLYIPKEEKPSDNPLRFDGEVYVLIGTGTYSSAQMFACTVKDYSFATLIGEETGGLATAYGEVYSFDLLNTRLPANVSCKRFVRPSGIDDGRGVLPDIEVKQTAEDTEKGIDTVLNYTIELIRKQNSITTQK